MERWREYDGFGSDEVPKCRSLGNRLTMGELLVFVHLTGS